VLEAQLAQRPALGAGDTMSGNTPRPWWRWLAGWRRAIL